MLRRIDWRFSVPSLASTFIVFMALAIAIMLGAMTTARVFGARELIIFILLAGTALLVLAPSDRILEFGFAGWILTFGFGWRTVHLYGAFTIHPSEAVVWVLFFLLLTRRILQQHRLDLSISILVPILLLFGVIGIGRAVELANPLSLALSESKAFFAVIPSFFVVQWLVKSRSDWERAARLATLVAVYISCLGLLDYFSPELSQSLAGGSAVETTEVSIQGFERAGFIFYGSPAGSFVVLMFLGFAIQFFLEYLGADWGKSLVSMLMLLIALAGIYVSGYRGAWYAVAALVLVFALMQRRAWVLLMGGLVALPAMPSDFYLRFISVFDLRYADSSQFKRLERASEGLNLIFQSPLQGVGWAGSGYVHSDLIQLAANLGVPALLVFVTWIARTMWSLFHLARQPGWIGRYGVALLATAAALLVSFAGEGLLVYAQLMLPVWFIFAMAERLRRFAVSESAASEQDSLSTFASANSNTVGS